MNSVTVELDHDTVDEIFVGQLKYWLNHHKQQCLGTATWYVHPDDREESFDQYVALKKILDFHG